MAPTPDPGDRPRAQPPTSPMAPLDVAGSSTSALAMLPEVLTVCEAAAILRVGATSSTRRSRSASWAWSVSVAVSTFPKQALRDLLTAASPPTANGDE